MKRPTDNAERYVEQEEMLQDEQAVEIIRESLYSLDAAYDDSGELKKLTMSPFACSIAQIIAHHMLNCKEEIAQLATKFCHNELAQQIKEGLPVAAKGVAGM